MIKKSDLKKYRHNFRYYLAKNPNYFGNFPTVVAGMEKVVELKRNTHFEELGCVSFNPETNELRATVTVKKASGYSGNSCSKGSLEYVRFFVDYKQNGNWVDEGVVHFNAHDLPFREELCYGVKLSISPKRRSCCYDKPVLPRVRAILSWNQEPPANEPNWPPVWGNVVEANIQIAPLLSFFCNKLKPKLKALDVNIPTKVLKLLAKTKELQKEEKAVELPPVDLAKLKKVYGTKVEDARLAFKAAQGLMAEPAQPALLKQVESLKKIGIDLNKVIKFIKKPKFKTQYEELKCVAMNRQMNVLHGAIHIKRQYGYSGDLCSQKGSREYIAFYMDFGKGWKYMGTTSVAVHDVNLPKDGLWYNAALPVSLTKYQKNWCKTGKAKVRGILSWNAAPTPNDPGYVAVWGDWEQCYVEIKPLPQGVPAGEIVPVIDILGGMPVDLIDNNGLANGAHTSVGSVVDAPFDGRIKIQGMVANAPDSSQPLVNRLKYRIMMKAPSSVTHHPLFNKFRIRVRGLNGGILLPQLSVIQTPDATEGWVEYYPDYKGPDLTWEIENLLGEFYPSEEGLHDMYLELLDPVTSTIISSNNVKFEVDKTKVDVDIEITSGDGNCGTYTVGDTLEGTFFIKDKNCAEMSLSVSPHDEAHGVAPVTKDNPPYSYHLNASDLVYKNLATPLSGTGIPAGKWKLDTNGMDACGYNIRIYGRERTIVNSNSINRYAWDSEGFCLKAKGN